MTETRKPRKRRLGARKHDPETERSRDSDEAERAVGRAVAIGLPAITLGGALIAGAVASLGSALLVLAAGMLVGTIALLWVSVRTLSGDAPLAEGFRTQTFERGDLKALLEEKRRALRALKDLESEHALGKIDDEDYRQVVEQYRGEAKRILRAIDDMIAPYRGKAEEMARAYLEKQGLAREGAHREPAASESSAEDDDSSPSALEGPAEGAVTGEDEPQAPDEEDEEEHRPVARVECKSCGGSNEPDAVFCKHCGSSMRDAKAPEKSSKGDAPAA